MQCGLIRLRVITRITASGDPQAGSFSCRESSQLVRVNWDTAYIAQLQLWSWHLQQLMTLDDPGSATKSRLEFFWLQKANEHMYQYQKTTTVSTLRQSAPGKYIFPRRQGRFFGTDTCEMQIWRYRSFPASRSLTKRRPPFHFQWAEKKAH